MMRKGKYIKATRVKLIEQKQATISMIVGCPNIEVPKMEQKKTLKVLHRIKLPLKIRKNQISRWKVNNLCQNSRYRIMGIKID